MGPHEQLPHLQYKLMSSILYRTRRVDQKNVIFKIICRNRYDLRRRLGNFGCGIVGALSGS